MKDSFFVLPTFRSECSDLLHLRPEEGQSTLTETLARQKKTVFHTLESENPTFLIKSYCFMFLNHLSGSCSTPRFLSNGQRHYSSTTVGSRVTYTCNPGYRLTSGSSSRACQSDGLWSGSHPTCTRKSTTMSL